MCSLFSTHETKVPTGIFFEVRFVVQLLKCIFGAYLYLHDCGSGNSAVLCFLTVLEISEIGP